MEVLIQGGLIYDGSGRDPFEGDVLIRDDRIQEIGQGLTTSGQVIHAEGLAVAPGFIDQHTHTDRTIFEVPSSASKITQGVTSEITGNCGIGAFPVADAHKQELLDYLDMLYSSGEAFPMAWHDCKGFCEAVNAARPGPNILPLCAHGALRMAVMGTEERRPDGREMEDMKNLLRRQLDQGAWGMSTGLVYPPGSFADTEELTELAKVLSASGAVFTSHVRGESGTLLEADNEIISISEKTGCRAVISHLKAIGKEFWGDGVKALRNIEKHRASGADVWADQYPYEATNTGLSVLAPEWAHDGGIEALIRRMQDPETRPRLLRDMEARMETRGGPSCVQLSNIVTEEYKKYLGKNLQEIADEWGVRPVEAAADIFVHEHGAVSACYFSLGKVDVETIIQSPIVSVISDGFGMDLDHTGQAVHPRCYGTFTRVLGRYVREKQLLGLPLAIYKMTGLPASIFHIPERGLLQPGYYADVTVFDPDRVIDKATFVNPHQYSEGVEYVFVNGVLSVKHGALTGDTGGQAVVRSYPR